MSTNAETREHHPYSPSTLQNLEACPCYLSKQAETPHERTTAGTRAHGVAETGVDDNRLDDDDAAAAAECLDFVDQRRQLMEEARAREVQKIALTLINPYATPDHSEEKTAQAEKYVLAILELKETYLPIDDLEFKEKIYTTVKGTDGKDYPFTKEVIVKGTTAGYIDHGFVSHDRKYAELFDWKFGFWPVEQADNNLQGLAYCLGIMRAHPQLERVMFFFKQPHLQTLSQVLVTRDQVPALYLRIQVVVAKARTARQEKNFATANPMVPVCNFCANIATCPAVTALACRVGNKFHPLAIPENITPSMLHNTRDTTLGLALAQVVAVWAKSYKTQITDRILRGEADIPPGQTLQQRADREIVDRDKYKEIALKHITEKQYADACSVTFGKVEEIIKDKAPRGLKTATLEVFNKELADSGAVIRGQPYTFLRAIPEKSDKPKTES
jgi:hypothetical protein